MRIDFTTKILAAAASAVSLAQLVSAGLPRSCFFVTPMHGPDSEYYTQYKSNLPTLTALSAPDMRIKSIIGMEDQDEGFLTGLEMHLKNRSTELDLRAIASDLLNWDNRKIDFIEPFEKISIITDKTGVCDVVIKQGDEELSFSNDKASCDTQLPQVEAIELAISDVAPLVGFHGRVDEFGIVQLGLIFLDTVSEQCQESSDGNAIKVPAGLSNSEQAVYVESSVSEEEHERAMILEAILRLHTMPEIKETTEELDKKIVDLVKEHHIHWEEENGASSEVGLPRQCFFVTELNGRETMTETKMYSDLPMLIAMYQPGMTLQSMVAYEDTEENYLIGLQLNLKNYETMQSLELPAISSEAFFWDDRKIDFVKQVDKLSIVLDETGVCDVVMHSEYSAVSLSQNTMGCEVGLPGVEEVTMAIAQETPLVGFHGRVDDYGIVGLAPIFVDTVSKQCKHASSQANQMKMVEGLTQQEQSDYFEKQITEDEKLRAKVLEAILRLDTLKEAHETKAELTRKIEDLIEQLPINTIDGYMPASSEDFDALVERLSDETDVDEEDLHFTFTFEGQEVDTFEELLALEKQAGNKDTDSSISFVHDGQVINSFEELYALEERKKSEEINELLAEVAKYEEIIFDNEDYFEAEFEYMDDELDQLFKKMNDQEDEIVDMQSLIEQSKLLSETTAEQIEQSDSLQRVTTSEPKLSQEETDEEIRALVKWFAGALTATIIAGSLCGAICITALICTRKKREKNRLAQLQRNPQFRFQETTDPSGTAGGIPASNPIAHEDLAKELPTDNDNNFMTERGLTTGQVKREMYAKQATSSGSGSHDNQA